MFIVCNVHHLIQKERLAQKFVHTKKIAEMIQQLEHCGFNM